MNEKELDRFLGALRDQWKGCVDETQHEKLIQRLLEQTKERDRDLRHALHASWIEISRVLQTSDPTFFFLLTDFICTKYYEASIEKRYQRLLRSLTRYRPDARFQSEEAGHLGPGKCPTIDCDQFENARCPSKQCFSCYTKAAKAGAHDQSCTAFDVWIALTKLPEEELRKHTRESQPLKQILQTLGVMQQVPQT